MNYPALVVHSPRVFSLKRMLSPKDCRQLIELAETKGFSAAQIRTDAGTKPMPTVRNNDRAMLESPDWVAQLATDLLLSELPILDGQRPIGLPKDLRFYRYDPGQRFKMHKDGPWKEAGYTSKLTFLVYLNDDFTGGGTDFRDFRVQPETGDALLFVHDTWHEGEAVTSGRKYVLRSDVLYTPLLAASAVPATP